MLITIIYNGIRLFTCTANNPPYMVYTPSPCVTGNYFAHAFN